MSEDNTQEEVDERQPPTVEQSLMMRLCGETVSAVVGGEAAILIDYEDDGTVIVAMQLKDHPEIQQIAKVAVDPEAEVRQMAVNMFMMMMVEHMEQTNPQNELLVPEKKLIVPGQ